jgi:uncharacterized membrane protein YhaH (DUF805 family)
VLLILLLLADGPVLAFHSAYEVGTQLSNGACCVAAGCGNGLSGDMWDKAAISDGLLSLFDLEGRLSRRGFGIVFMGYGAFVLTASLFFRPPVQAYVVVPVLAPAIALVFFAMIRRLHDRSKSGWWLLLIYGPVTGLAIFQTWFMQTQTTDQLDILFPIIALLLALAFFPMAWVVIEIFLLQGTPGPNRFGPDPLARR